MTIQTHEKSDAVTIPTPTKPSKMSESPNKNFINDLPGVKEVDLPESGRKAPRPLKDIDENTEKTADAEFAQKLHSDGDAPDNSSDHSSDQY